MRPLAAPLVPTLCCLSLLATLALPASGQPAEAAAKGRPRLVLLVVADQFHGDYLERYANLFTGGFRTLTRSGVQFTEAHFEHANTLTAAGHATLSTGLHPRRHGIIGNYWYDRETGERIYCIEDEDGNDSPLRLEGSTFGDWLRRAIPASRIYTVSGKDRAAILLAGREADGAFWYSSSDGEMETSDFYPAAAGQLADRFNRRQLTHRYFGTLWEPLPVDEKVLAEVGIGDFDFGPLLPGFPHPIGRLAQTHGLDFFNSVAYSPIADELVAELGRDLIAQKDLGKDAETDLLALSFSALDRVGHRYGPDSREVLDILLRLDRTLDELFAWIDREVGLEHVLIVFTSDHGGVPAPEVRQAAGLSGKRIGKEEIVCVARVLRGVDEKLGGRHWLLTGPRVDPQIAAAAGYEVSEVLGWLVAGMEACPNIRRVWTREMLLAPPADAPGARLFHNAYHPQRGPDFLLQFAPYFLWTQTSASSHLSPYDYDTHVPLVFRLPDGKGRIVNDPVGMVDLAPTLAGLLGVAAPADLDGIDRSALVELPTEGE